MASYVKKSAASESSGALLSIIHYSITGIAYNHHTDIYPLLHPPPSSDSDSCSDSDSLNSADLSLSSGGLDNEDTLSTTAINEILNDNRSDASSSAAGSDTGKRPRRKPQCESYLSVKERKLPVIGSAFQTDPTNLHTDADRSIERRAQERRQEQDLHWIPGLEIKDSASANDQGVDHLVSLAVAMQYVPGLIVIMNPTLAERKAGAPRTTVVVYRESELSEDGNSVHCYMTSFGRINHASIANSDLQQVVPLEDIYEWVYRNCRGPTRQSTGLCSPGADAFNQRSMLFAWVKERARLAVARQWTSQQVYTFFLAAEKHGSRQTAIYRELNSSMLSRRASSVMSGPSAIYDYGYLQNKRPNRGSANGDIGIPMKEVVGMFNLYEVSR